MGLQFFNLSLVCGGMTLGFWAEVKRRELFQSLSCALAILGVSFGCCRRPSTVKRDGLTSWGKLTF